MMFDNDIFAGQKLVASDLAAKLGISRTPVNSVLFHLAKQGFLDLRPKQGYTVHQLTRNELDSLYDMREVLELGAIEKAIANLSEEKLRELGRKERLFSTAVAEGLGRRRFQVDLDFHAFIVEMSGNRSMATYYREIYAKIFLSHRIVPVRGERIVNAPAEHHEIYIAIQERDLAKAKQAISAHIMAGKEYIESFLF